MNLEVSIIVHLHGRHREGGVLREIHSEYSISVPASQTARGLICVDKFRKIVQRGDTNMMKVTYQPTGESAVVEFGGRRQGAFTCFYARRIE